MIHVHSHHPPGVLVVSSGDLSRFTEFTTSLEGTHVPVGSGLVWQRGQDVCKNRNAGIEQMLAVPESQWVWLLDDDHQWPAELLLRLLDRQVDILQPLVSTRYPPFVAISAATMNGTGMPERLPWGKIPATGLLATENVGAGALLVRRRALERMGFPWFDPGNINPGQMNEDVAFSHRAAACGLELWTDCEHRIGHASVCAIWPVPGEGVDIAWNGGRSRVRLVLESGCTVSPSA